MPTVTVPVSSGRLTAIIDEADGALVLPYHWTGYTSPRSHTYYAGYWDRLPSGKHQVVPMHRLILGAPGAMRVDHRNGNGLDNRRANLRLATAGQNNANSCKRSDNTSGFRGVSWDRTRHLWLAKISVAGRTVNLGRFASLQEAADAYDRAAMRFFGEFARINGT